MTPTSLRYVCEVEEAKEMGPGRIFCFVADSFVSQVGAVAVAAAVEEQPKQEKKAASGKRATDRIVQKRG